MDGLAWPIYYNRATGEPYPNDEPTCIACGSSRMRRDRLAGYGPERVAGPDGIERDYRAERWRCLACNVASSGVHTIVLAYVSPAGSRMLAERW